MDDKESTIPEVVDFSIEALPQTTWLHYLIVVFCFILFCNVVRAFDVSSRLHGLLIFLCSVITAAGRKRRSEKARLMAELRSMRAELKTINMVQQFATYSKLERRIKATSRQLDQLAPETLDKSIMRFVGIKVVLFVCEGTLTGWLISRCPPETFSKLELNDAQLRYSFLFPLVRILYYLPAKLVVLLWVGLCHWFCVPISKWIRSKRSRVLTSPPVEQMCTPNEMD